MTQYSRVDPQSQEFERLLDKYPNWRLNRKFIDHIEWTGTTGGLRNVARNDWSLDRLQIIIVLQYELRAKVVFARGVSFGSWDAHKEDFGTLWVDVPLEKEEE